MAIATTVVPDVTPTSSASAAPVWASALVGLQAVAAEVDYDVLGLPRFPVWIVVFMMPIPLLALRSPQLLTLLWRRPHRAATVWLGWCALTTAWSVVPVSSARTMLTIIGLWTTAAWYTANFGFTRFARVYLAAMAMFMTAGFVRDLIIVLDAETVHRFDGFGLHATDVGRIALITVVIATVQLVDRLSRSWIVWWGLAIGLVTLVATGTRTTLIALVICLLVISLRTVGPGRTFLIGLVMAAAVAVAISFIPDPGKFVSRDENAQDISSINGRVTIWSVAIDSTLDAPVGGSGVAAGELLFPQASQRGELPILIQHAHNMVLELSMTTGLVGLTLFVLAITSYLAASRTPGGRLSAVVLLAIILAGVAEAVLGRSTATYLVLAALFTERVDAGSSVAAITTRRPVGPHSPVTPHHARRTRVVGRHVDRQIFPGTEEDGKLGIDG